MSATSSPRAELEGLLSLITAATHDAMAVYEKSGHGIPSIHSTTHPLDTESTTLALKKAIRTLEGACEQLITTLAPPNHTILNVSSAISQHPFSSIDYPEQQRSMVLFQPAAMRIVVEARIPDMLVMKPKGLSVNELAEKSGLSAGKLRRIIRALATKHVFREGIQNF